MVVRGGKTIQFYKDFNKPRIQDPVIDSLTRVFLKIAQVHSLQAYEEGGASEVFKPPEIGIFGPFNWSRIVL